MKQLFFSAIVVILTCLQQASAQNTSPYWSLSGNSNASNTTSKLGTTNAFNLRLFTNNVERMRILSSNGNVGVGTVSPTDRLHLNTPSGTNALRAQVNGSTKLLVASNGGLAVGANQTPPTNGLFVNGNVGIGINTPSYKLHVVGTTGSAIYATTNTSIGVEGHSTAQYGNGVYGNGFIGVQGYSFNDWGVYGESNGIYGNGLRAYTTGQYAISVYAEGVGASSYGVSATGGHAGIWATGDTYAGLFIGSVYTTGSYLPSASKLKENIIGISGAMALLSKLHPMEYEYKQDGSYGRMNLPKGKRYGLIAEEVEQVLPTLVKETTFDTRMAKKQGPGTLAARQAASEPESIDFKAVNYTELIPIMVRGMQEQEAENQALKAEVEALRPLKDEVAELRRMVLELKISSMNVPTSTSAYLEQNTPNPVSGTTTIRYYIPETSTSADLTLTNAKGQVVKTISLGSRGSGQVSLNTSALPSGTYNYTLYVDDKPVEVKRLVIAR